MGKHSSQYEGDGSLLSAVEDHVESVLARIDIAGEKTGDLDLETDLLDLITRLVLGDADDPAFGAYVQETNALVWRQALAERLGIGTVDEPATALVEIRPAVVRGYNG